MRSKLLGLRKNFINVIQAKNYASKSPECEPHMNELPVPCIPWEPWYSDKQSAYNRVLFIGISWFLFSFGMFLYSDSCYFNFRPPAQPAPPVPTYEELAAMEEQNL